MSARAVTCVAVGGKYPRGMQRLNETVKRFGGPDVQRYMFSGYPKGCPPHDDVPYAFKAYAIEHVRQQGADVVIWADASVHVVHDMKPLWQRIEERGYYFPDNGGWTTDQWCSDHCLAVLGMRREEIRGIPHMAATVMGLDFRNELASTFFERYLREAKDGRAFRGAWVNNRQQVSKDPNVLGHRHDQTVASIIAYGLGMEFTPQPQFFAYKDYIGGKPPAAETILEAAGDYK